MDFESMNRVITFTTGDTVNQGDLVKITGDYEVSLCANGEKFDGIVVSVRDDICGVMLAGAARASYSGTLSYGDNEVTVDSSGKLVTATDGKTVKVVDLDSTNNIATILF